MDLLFHVSLARSGDRTATFCSRPQRFKTHKNNVKYRKGERLDFEFKARRKKFQTVENKKFICDAKLQVLYPLS